MIRFVLHLVTYDYSLVYTSKLNSNIDLLPIGLDTHSKAGKSILILSLWGNAYVC